MARLLGVAFALTLAGCSPAPRAVTVVEAGPDEGAKREILAAFQSACDLDALKARPSTPPLPSAPEPPPPPPGGSAFEPHLFIEVALFTAPAVMLKDPHPDLALVAVNPGVRLIAAPHLSAALGRETRLRGDEHVGPLSRLSLRELVLEPVRTTDSGALVIELDAHLQLPQPPDAPASPAPPEERVHLVATAAVRSTATLTSELRTSRGEAVLALLRVYPVNEEADLRAIFECKLEEHRRALAAAR
jgi:hypothetical protein